MVIYIYFFGLKLKLYDIKNNMPPKQVIDTELSKRFVHLTAEQHAAQKSMWGGKQEASINTHIIYTDKIEELTATYPLLLLNCFNEIIENVSDAHNNTIGLSAKKRTNKCDIKYDGYITVQNNGNGIPVGKVLDSEGKAVPVAELVSTRMFAGSNINENKQSVTAGTNGVGMTMVNVSSDEFILRTVDLDRNLYFEQKSTNRMNNIEDCCIRKSRKDESGTTITWRPSYENAHKFPPTPENMDTLNKLFKTRAMQMAMSNPDMKITYNGESILEDKKLKASKVFFNRYIGTENGVYTTIGTTHPWVVMITLSSKDDIALGSLINGIVVGAGTHITGIKKLIFNGLKPLCTTFVKKYREFKPSMINNNIQVFIIGKYPNPSFDSQSKNSITGSPGDLKEYSFSDKDIKSIWNLLKPRIESEFIVTKTKTTTTKKSTNDIPKYISAHHINRKNVNCTLFVAEGDSALATVKAGLASKEVKSSRDNCGTFSIQGVPINSRKASSVSRNDDNTEQKVTQNAMLLNNERLKWFERILNLDKTIVYDTPEKLATIPYKYITMIVDQDLDGVGQILGLLISHIHRFWPELFNNGMIKFMSSPIIRAYPKNKQNTVQHFYTESQYDTWCHNVDISKWNVKYYKGLATHTIKEAVDIFKKNVCTTITSDMLSEERLNVYYGIDPAPRKIELTHPIKPHVVINNTVTINDHLDEHTKGFQLANLEQKLPNIIDGLKESQRKALYGMIRMLGMNKSAKIAEMSGFISADTGYHHGQDSLSTVLITMAQAYINAAFRIPLIKGIGQFGTRAENGNDHGSPRYVSGKVMAVTRKIFRSEDDAVLKYVVDEGVSREPTVYSPIIPFVLTQFLQCIAAGFATTSYPREWNDIVANVKYIINNPDDIKHTDLKRMGFDKGRWKGNVEKKGALGIYSTGTYIRKSNKIINVTELPFGVGTTSYITKLKNRDGVVSVRDNSGIEDINLIVEFSELDPDKQITLLALSKKFTKNLNFMLNGRVVTCDYYKDVIVHWYEHRHATYKLRFQREEIVLTLQILQLENKLKFIQNRSKYKIEQQNIDSIDLKLQNAKFDRLNTAVINSPGIIPTEKLLDLATDTKLDNVNYKYLLNLTNYQQLTTAKDALVDEIKKKKELLIELANPDHLKHVWLKELTELDDMVQLARNSKSGWDHGEPVFKM